MNIEKLKKGDLAESINHGNPELYIRLIVSAFEAKTKDQQLTAWATIGEEISKKYALHTDALEYQQDIDDREAQIWGEIPESKGAV